MYLTKFLWILFLTAAALPNVSTCPDLFERDGGHRPLYLEKAILQADQPKEQVFLGVLLQLSGRKQVLGIGHEYVGHSGIKKGLEFVYGKGRVRRILWAGELKFRLGKSSDETHLLMANEMSGLIRSYRTEKKKASIKSLKYFLKTSGSGWLNDESKLLPFAKSSQHLNEELNRFGMENFRHDMANTFNQISLLLETVLIDYRSQPPKLTPIEVKGTFMMRRLEFASLFLFIKIFKQQGFSDIRLTEADLRLRLLLVSHELSVEDLYRAKKSLNLLIKLFKVQDDVPPEDLSKLIVTLEAEAG